MSPAGGRSEPSRKHSTERNCPGSWATGTIASSVFSHQVESNFSPPAATSSLTVRTSSPAGVCHGNSTAHRIALKPNARAASDRAQSWLLSADSITDHNEFEVAEPQVALRAERIEDFQSGWQSQLPPFSMRVLAWEVGP